MNSYRSWNRSLAHTGHGTNDEPIPALEPFMNLYRSFNLSWTHTCPSVDTLFSGSVFNVNSIIQHFEYVFQEFFFIIFDSWAVKKKNFGQLLIKAVYTRSWCVKQCNELKPIQESLMNLYRFWNGSWTHTGTVTAFDLILFIGLYLDRCLCGRIRNEAWNWLGCGTLKVLVPVDKPYLTVHKPTGQTSSELEPGSMRSVWIAWE